MRGDFAAPAAGRVPPCGAGFFPNDGKENKGSPLRGRLTLSALRSYSPYPRSPALRGTLYWKVQQNFRRAKSEWLLSFHSGPLGPGLAKIDAGAVPQLRLDFRAIALGSSLAVGAPHVAARPAFPLQGGRCPRRGLMRVTSLAVQAIPGGRPLGLPYPNQGFVGNLYGGGLPPPPLEASPPVGRDDPARRPTHAGRPQGPPLRKSGSVSGYTDPLSCT